MAGMADLRLFFEAYGRAFADGAKLAAFYGDCALGATPTFAGVLKGEDEVRAALAGVAEYQLKTGMTSVAPLDVAATELDALHTWAKVRWAATFEKTGARQVEFDVSYLLRRGERGLTILASVSHQDEQQLRAELGLL